MTNIKEFTGNVYEVCEKQFEFVGKQVVEGRGRWGHE